MHAAVAPSVFTGAIRPSSNPGADGLANLEDAVAVAASDAASGTGVLVVFGGEIHAAHAVRKASSISPAAFRSPSTGPLGAVAEGVVRVWARPARVNVLAVASTTARVPSVATWLGDDGALLDAAAGDADGIVLVALGAGHVPPPVLAALRHVAPRIPVCVAVRPENGVMLRSTYGFEGSESDIRSSGAISCSALSPAAARIALIAALGANVDPAAALAQFDT
jgi:L-asparaginase